MTPRLTELQDRMLAMADDEWMDLGTAKSILESWLASPVSDAELHGSLSVLMNLELISCTIKSQPKTAEALRLPEDFSVLEFKASGKGVRYLADEW